MTDILAFWGKIYPTVVAGLILAAVVGIWQMNEKMTTVVTTLGHVQATMELRRQEVDRRLGVIEGFVIEDRRKR